MTGTRVLRLLLLSNLSRLLASKDEAFTGAEIDVDDEDSFIVDAAAVQTLNDFSETLSSSTIFYGLIKGLLDLYGGVEGRCQ